MMIEIFWGFAFEMIHLAKKNQGYSMPKKNNL